MPAARTWGASEDGDGTAPTSEAALAPTADDTGRVFASRYVLVQRIGSGGFGAVWLARDRVLGGTLAIKLIHRAGALAAGSRRELAALRLVVLPGVVRLLDDGEEDGVAWIAMERLSGVPFLAGSGKWADIAEDVRSLLSTLAALHRLGIVHGDLKPANILHVEGRGPVVLDFGISRGRGVEALPSERAGGFSRAYAAPEQIAGRSPTPRSDLYSLGVMLFEYLCGTSLRSWRTMRAPDSTVRDLAHDLPDEVLRGLMRLVAEDPEQRPQSAEELWASWGGVTSPAPTFSRSTPWTEAELASLFRGPERLLHLPSDAARELMARTDGEARAVNLELEAWERAGLASRDDGGYRVGRAALDRLAAGVQIARADGGLAHRPPVDVTDPRELLALAAIDRRAGRRGVARIRVQLGLDIARRAGLAETEDDLLSQLCLLAFAEERIDQVALALYAIERSAETTPRREALGVLAHAFREHLSGSRTVAAERAAGIAPFTDDELECTRVALIVFASSLAMDAEAESALDAWEAWSKVSPLRRARWYGWRAVFRYRLGHMADAARMHADAAVIKAEAGAPFDSILASRYQAAAAFLEGSRLEAARALARDVEVDAAAARLPAVEATAVWIRRMVACRREEVSGPDPALVDAAAEVSSREEALLASGEAVIAWRTGHADLAAALLSRAIRLYEARGHTVARLLFEALAWSLFSREEAEADRILTELEAVSAPANLRVQILGLLVAGRPALRRTLDRALRAAAGPLPVGGWGGARDVLSVAEALGLDRSITEHHSPTAG